MHQIKKPRTGQEGSVTTEFVMVLPLLAVAMLFLIGLGYTIMTKQNAVVGARAAVFYRASLEEAPTDADLTAMIKDAVSPEREEWTLEEPPGSVESPDLGVTGVIQGAVSALFGNLNKEIRYTVSGTATLGFLPRIMDLGRARSSYYLPHRTWTCKQWGGSYTRIVMSGVGVPSPVDRMFDLSCCESYQATR